MVHQLGTPTWFSHCQQLISNGLYGVYYTDDDVAGLSFDDKSNWLKRTQLLQLDTFNTD